MPMYRWTDREEIVLNALIKGRVGGVAAGRGAGVPSL
jgi:hypothetical protein